MSAIPELALARFVEHLTALRALQRPEEDFCGLVVEGLTPEPIVEITTIAQSRQRLDDLPELQSRAFYLAGTNALPTAVRGPIVLHVFASGPTVVVEPHGFSAPRAKGDAN